MDATLFHIVYCSRNLVGTIREEQDREVRQILEKARSNNSRLSVTGALLYSDGFFAQVLEGPLTSVEQIFENIQRDRRHGDVTVLECSPIVRRDFPDWSMAYVHPDSPGHADVSSQTLLLAMQDPSAGGYNVLKLLRSLAIDEEERL